METRSIIPFIPLLLHGGVLVLLLVTMRAHFRENKTTFLKCLLFLGFVHILFYAFSFLVASLSVDSLRELLSVAISYLQPITYLFIILYFRHRIEQ